MQSDDSPAIDKHRPQALDAWVRRWCGGGWPVALLLACIAVFAADPRLDIAASRAFVGADGQFLWQHDPAIAFVHESIAQSSRWIAAALALAWLGSFAVARVWPALAARRRTFGYVFLVLAIGPGLIVNAALKEHWGRARPAQTVEFGGHATYTPPFQPTDQCAHNCSFTSGHVAYAAMPVAGYFFASTPRRRRAWLIAGVALAIMVAFMRMAMGGHFLSDTLFSFWITWFTAAACAGFLHKPLSPEIS